jgi:gliding motility-associated-like protein
MNLKVLLSTVFVLFLLTQDIKTQIIADALPGCLQIIDQQGVECNNASTTDFGVSGNQFIVNNIDGTSCSCIGGLGNTNAYFIFEVINISGYSNIGISFDYSADNVTYEDLSPVPVYDCNADMAINQSHDQIVFEYAVDGGPWILGEYIHGTTGFDFTGTWTESGINGSTLQIRVIVSAKSSAEKFYFTNLDITGTPNPPSAGSDLSGCPGTPITLQGSGTGTWSGGMGTFGDISNPTTTYTPDASETGTITLFYSGTPPTPGCGNGPTDEMDITISSPEGTLQGTGILCPGECATITVAFMNGTPPYILDLEFSSNALPFSFPFTVPGFEVNDIINICYEEGGILPTFDQSTNTLTLPGIVGGFSGTLDLVALSDQTCSNIPQNGPNINFTFLVKPDAFPASLEGCDDGSGNAEFDLSSIESTILGNQGGSVEFYSDFGLTNLISSPYYSSDATIYAVVVGTNGCLSDPVEVQLSVLGNGDAGVITFLCESETSCVICDEDGMLGEEVELTINFEDPGMDYYIEIIYFINGIQMTYEGTIPGSGGVIPFFIDANASFQIIAVTPSDDCRDVTDMPPAIDITYLLRPDIDPINPFEVCEPVVLPPITGTNLTGSEYYSTSEDGTGAIFLAGDIVNFDTPLYAFSGVYPDCYDAENFFILIGEETVLTAPDNDTTCGFYILPPIPGQAMGSTVQYYTELDGMGTAYLPGDTIFVSDSLFLFDPQGDCPSNQPYFHINLAGDIIYDSLGIIFGCEEVILPEITGQGVTDSARYFTMPDGNGIQFFTGDTIMISDTFYMFDPTTQCTQDTAFLITNIGGGTLYNDIPDTSACGFYILPSIEGDNVGINAMYFSQPNGGGIGYNPGDTIFTNTDMFVFDTTSNCNINQPQFLITVLQEVVFDIPNNLVDCDPITLPQISGQNLSGNENYFSGPNGSGVIIPEGTLFNSDTIIYLYSGASPCPVDQEIIISINNLQSGIAKNYSLCSGTGIINLWDGVLPPFTPGGEWSEQGSSVFDLTDPENVIIPEDVIPGTYRFAYTLIIPGCPIAQTVHRVNIVSTPEVGNDTTISFCGNPASIDLLEYSSPDGADTSFESLYGSVALNGSIADISGLSEGNYTFYVISQNSDQNNQLQCIDTAVITLILSENPSAGDNNSTTVCKGNLINLNDYISNFDNIGVFELPAFPGVLNGSDLDTDLLPLGTVTAWHILPESGGCAADTAFITINIIDKPDAGIDVNVSECNTGTYDLLNYISVADQSGEFISIDNNYVINGTILSVDAAGSTEIYYVLGNGTTCPKDSSIISIEIFDPQPQNYEDTTCEDTYDFEGITFTPSNNSQEVILTSISGCDSIVNVEITFNSAVNSDLNASICPGDSIVVNGNVYNANLLTGQEVFSGMAANGCDSIVNINLTLNEGFETFIDTSTCNPDISIIIGNDEYNALNPNGSTTLQTKEGCDSTINVNINIIPFTYTFDIIQPECEGDNGTFTITEFNGAQAITIIENGQSSDYTLADLPIELSYAPGSYQITINSIDGICGITETVVIDEAIIPEGNIIATMISDSVWQLSLEIDANVTTYFWTALGGTLDCWDCPNPILTGAAEVVLIYDYGLICTDNTSLTLEILIDNSFHLPNIFSPNADQINDNFTIRVNEDNTLIIETFEIYDRWGNQVISLNDIAPSDGQILWDGKMNGKNVTPGVYVYVIKVKNGNESITNFGEITVIR